MRKEMEYKDTVIQMRTIQRREHLGKYRFLNNIFLASSNVCVCTGRVAPICKVRFSFLSFTRRRDFWPPGIRSDTRHSLDLADGRDQDELEDEKSEKGGRDDGQEELLHATCNFGSHAWLLEDFILQGHVAIVLNLRHFLFDFFLLIINS